MSARPLPPRLLPRSLPRRGALVLGGAGVAALAGCDLGGDRTDTDPAPAPDAGSDPDPDPDQALVDEVTAAVTAVWGLTAGRPALAAVHAAHLEALGGEVPPGTERRRARTEVLRRREEALRADLVAAAIAARSGALARLLASMSAALAQQVAVL